MILEPTETPVTTPELLFTVATEGVPEDHMPPEGEPVRVICCVTQTVDGPVIVGKAFTVKRAVLLHPLLSV